MRLLIVDDEALARLRLRTLVGDVAASLEPPPVVVGEAADADQAAAFLRAAAGLSAVDVVLLDIRMPGPGGRPGLQLAADLRALPKPPAVIFVTAHAEHALRAFELEAVDYLTKPVRRERLLEALRRVQARTAVAAAATGPPADEPVLVVSDRGRVLRIPLAEVLYLKAELKYVTLRTADHSHVLDESLAELEPRLVGHENDFIRVHRNALVARRAIRALELRKGASGGADAGTDAGVGTHAGTHAGVDADAAGAETGEGWAVRVAPIDEWLSVSRRQVGAVRAALSREPSV
ncbi:MAG: LytTR family DNA-binding domain-containing protein [Rubrivivax sp.]